MVGNVLTKNTYVLLIVWLESIKPNPLLDLLTIATGASLSFQIQLGSVLEVPNVNKLVVLVTKCGIDRLNTTIGSQILIVAL